MQAGIALGNIASVLSVPSEEAGIVSELKAGSEEAFAWLIAKYHQPLYSLIARTIPDPADAADLTQDVFIKIYRGIGGFNGDSSLRTWIYRIALREASNQRRWWGRHKRQEVTIETEFGDTNDGHSLCLRDTLVDAHESPFDLAAQEEVRARVEEELRSQKAKYEESSEDVLRRMQDIKEAEADSVADLGAFVDAELEYYDRCRDELLRLKKDWPAG